MFGTCDIGIDLGTTTLQLAVKGKGIVLEEPSMIAIDRDTGRLIAVGEEAQRMLGRTPETILTISPLQEGVVSDGQAVRLMLQDAIRRAVTVGRFTPLRVLLCIPEGVTDLEKRAVAQAAFDIGARMVRLVEEPVAAALGAGLDVLRPLGHMVVDVGGGTTDIAVISMGKSILSESLRVGGSFFDRSIIEYIKEEHHFLIGEPTSWWIKSQIGCVSQREELLHMEVMGQDMISGLPRLQAVHSDEIMEALNVPMQAICDRVQLVFEQLPADIAEDLFSQGILLTGGGAMVWGMDRRISLTTGVPCRLAEDPQRCVIRGIVSLLEKQDVFENAHQRVSLVSEVKVE